MLTYPTVTHTFLNGGDGTPASGVVTFTLSTPVTNGGVTLVPSTVTAALSATGELSQTLASNLDVGTIPENSTWLVTERILGSPERSYAICLPSASAGALSVDLGSLMPGVTPAEAA